MNVNDADVMFVRVMTEKEVWDNKAGATVRIKHREVMHDQPDQKQLSEIFNTGGTWTSHFGVQVVEAHPIRFHAVLQAVRFETTRGGSRLWVKDVMTDTHYPMPAKAVEKMILNVEPQGIGLWDGKWRLRKSGAWLGVWPVLAEEEDEE